MKKIATWVSTLFLLFGIAGQAYADIREGRRGFMADNRRESQGRVETQGGVREATRPRFHQRQLDQGTQVPAEKSLAGEAGALDNQRDGQRINRNVRDGSDIRSGRPDVAEEGGRRGRLTIEERRALRRQIREAVYDIYNRQRY